MDEKQRYSKQQAHSTFQPQTYRHTGLEQVNPGRTETHSSAAPNHVAAKTLAPIHQVKAGDTLWDIAKAKLGDGSRWTELQKKEGGAFTEKEAHQLHIGTSVYLPETKSKNASQLAPKSQVHGADFRVDFKSTTREAAKSDDRPIPSRSDSVLAQSTSIAFSGADLIKAVQSKSGGFSHPAGNQPSYQVGIVQGKSRFTQKAQESTLAKNGNHSLNLSDVAKGAAVGVYVANRKLTPKAVPTEASRAAKPLIYSVTDEKGKRLIRSVRLRNIRASQGDISGKLRNGTPVRSVVDSMKKHGWDHTAQPPDMVKFEGRKLSVGQLRIPISRGYLTTLDHRRIAAAKEAGLKRIPARIHSEHDPIRHDVPSRLGAAGQEEATRFEHREVKPRKGTLSAGQTSRYKPGYQPQTWGEAVKIRSAEQIPRGYNLPSTGSKRFPSIKHEASGASKAGAEALRGSVTKGIAGGALRGASRAALPVAAAVDAYDLTKTYQQDGLGSKFRSQAAGVAGGWGGAALLGGEGAAIGTAIVPVVGTAIGGAVGGTLGYFGGSAVASKAEEGVEGAWNGFKSAGRSLLNGVAKEANSAANSAVVGRPTGGGIVDKVKSVWHDITNPFG